MLIINLCDIVCSCKNLVGSFNLLNISHAFVSILMFSFRWEGSSRASRAWTFADHLLGHLFDRCRLLIKFNTLVFFLFLLSHIASLLNGFDHVLPELGDVRLFADHHVDFAVASAVDITAGSSVTERRGGFNVHTHSPGVEKFRTPDVKNCARVMNLALALEHVTEGLEFFRVHVAVAQVLDKFGDGLT